CVSLIACSRNSGCAAICWLIGELDHPARLFPCVIFFEARALETAGETIAGSGDLELTLGDAHVDRAVPATATFRVLGIKVVVARRERALDQRLAGRAFNMPPALGDP